MTPAAHGDRPLASALRRGLHVVAVGATLAVASSVALAQQAWEATVTGSVAPAKPAASPWAAAVAAAASKPRPGGDAPAAPPDTKPAPLKTEAKPAASVVKGTPAEEYCTNIANPAADARFMWQKKMLAAMEQEIAKRVAAMEEKAAELQKWLARREEFSKKANETLLSIYTRMKPDAAAQQMAGLDEETAAALLIKLEPRKASLILNEMDSNQAIRLAATISGAGKFAPAASKNPTEAKAK
jgi:flagellar motility protein MotE (MotC chaperone)